MKKSNNIIDLYNYNFFGKIIEEQYVCINLLKIKFDSFIGNEAEIFKQSIFNPMTKRNYQKTNSLFNSFNDSEIEYLSSLGNEKKPITSKEIQSIFLNREIKPNKKLESIIQKISKQFEDKIFSESNYKWYGDTILKLNRVLNDSDEDFSINDSFYKFVIQNYLYYKFPDNKGNEKVSLEVYFNILVTDYYSKNRYPSISFESLVDDLISAINTNKSYWYKQYIIDLKENYGYSGECYKNAYLEKYLSSDWKLVNKRFIDESNKNEVTYYIFDKNRVKINPIYSLEILKKSLMKESLAKKTTLFFRGHSDSNFHFQPSIVRNINTFAHENNIYEESLARNPEEYAHFDQTHLDILKKMQHYNIPTRLMDITDNLLVGLFFAIESNQQVDGELIVLKQNISELKYTRSDSVSILCSLPPFSQKEKNSILDLSANLIDRNLKPEEKIKQLNEESIIKRLRHEINREKTFEPEIDPETFYKDLFVIPKRDNRRIIQQSGSFIICTLNINSHGAINKDRLEDNNSLKQIFIIPAKMKGDLINSLTLFGINNSTIYPEMEKVSDFIKEKYK